MTKIYRPNTATLERIKQLHRELGHKPSIRDYMKAFGTTHSTAARAVAIGSSPHYPDRLDTLEIHDIDSYILKNLPERSAYIIGAELGISNESVRLRAKELGMDTSGKPSSNRCRNCGLPISPQARGLCKECYNATINSSDRGYNTG